MAPAAVILDKTSFENYLQDNRMIFSGSGAAKWEKLTNSVHAEFFTQNNVNESFARISYRSFLGKKWLDLAYSEPIYLKEFYTHSKN
jgi:tRNA threonylcarbamoyladenosine biosynthesis protein TsaB